MARKKKAEAPALGDDGNYNILIGFVKSWEYKNPSHVKKMNGHPYIGRVYRLIKDDLGFRLHIGKENNNAYLDGFLLGETLNGERESFSFEIELVTPKNILTLPLTKEDTDQIYEWLKVGNSDLEVHIQRGEVEDAPVIRGLGDLIVAMAADQIKTTERKETAKPLPPQLRPEKQLYMSLPERVKTILVMSNGWLVGGSIKDIFEQKVPKDFDIIVPQDKWRDVVLLLNSYPTKINTFGGLKFYVDGYEVDVWVEDLGSFITTASVFTYAYNICKQKIVKTIDPTTPF